MHNSLHYDPDSDDYGNLNVPLNAAQHTTQFSLLLQFPEISGSISSFKRLTSPASKHLFFVCSQIVSPRQSQLGVWPVASLAPRQSQAQHLASHKLGTSPVASLAPCQSQAWHLACRKLGTSPVASLATRKLQDWHLTSRKLVTSPVASLAPRQSQIVSPRQSGHSSVTDADCTKALSAQQTFTVTGLQNFILLSCYIYIPCSYIEENMFTLSNTTATILSRGRSNFHRFLDIEHS